MSKRAILVTGMLLVMGLALQGCSAMYMFSGQGKQKAQFVLPKDKRVLVFVDMRQGVEAPPDFGAVLGTKIADHLFKYGAANRLVGQDRLTALQRDPAAFSKMGVADVAEAVKADLVVYVDVVTLRIASTTDNSLSQATSQVLVKVIDAKGVRMWPTAESTGSLVSANVDPTYTESRTDAVLINQLEDTLAGRIGRMFHEYSTDAKENRR